MLGLVQNNRILKPCSVFFPSSVIIFNTVAESLEEPIFYLCEIPGRRSEHIIVEALSWLAAFCIPTVSNWWESQKERDH
jgi:hypothetical protein